MTTTTDVDLYAIITKARESPIGDRAGHSGHSGAHTGHGGTATVKPKDKPSIEKPSTRPKKEKPEKEPVSSANPIAKRKEVEDRIRKSKTEVNVAFDKDGNVIAETDIGSASHTMFGPSQISKIRATKDAVTVHNHPTDHGFSPNDFHAAWGERVLETKVVTASFDYTMKVDKYQTWDKLQKILMRATKKYAEGQVARTHKGESMEQVRKTEIEDWHKILTDTAAKLPGVSYSRKAVTKGAT